MTLLKTFDPHSFSLIKSVKAKYAPSADASRDHLLPEETQKELREWRDFQRAAYRKYFYRQFQTVAELEGFIAEKAAGNPYDLDTLMAKEAQEAHENRKSLPYGAVETESGFVFDRRMILGLGLQDFKTAKEHVPNTVLYTFETTKQGFNICLIDHWNNTVREDAQEIGQQIAKRHNGGFFGKPVNVFVHTPMEERPEGEAPRDAFEQVVRKGKALPEPVRFDRLPITLDKFLFTQSGNLHYSDRDPRHNVQKAAQQRAYRLFTLANHPDMDYARLELTVL